MKHLLILPLVFLAFSSNSFARSVQLGKSARDSVQALLLAKQADILQFKSSGNSLYSISRAEISAETTQYNFVIRNCSEGGVTGATCLGGAQLQVEITEKRNGSQVVTTATSKVLRLRQ